MLAGAVVGPAAAQLWPDQTPAVGWVKLEGGGHGAVVSHDPATGRREVEVYDGSARHRLVLQHGQQWRDLDGNPAGPTAELEPDRDKIAAWGALNPDDFADVEDAVLRLGAGGQCHSGGSPDHDLYQDCTDWGLQMCQFQATQGTPFIGETPCMFAEFPGGFLSPHPTKPAGHYWLVWKADYDGNLGSATLVHGSHRHLDEYPNRDGERLRVAYGSRPKGVRPDWVEPPEGCQFSDDGDTVCGLDSVPDADLGPAMRKALDELRERSQATQPDLFKPVPRPDVVSGADLADVEPHGGPVEDQTAAPRALPQAVNPPSTGGGSTGGGSTGGGSTGGGSTGGGSTGGDGDGDGGAGSDPCGAPGQPPCSVTIQEPEGSPPTDGDFQAPDYDAFTFDFGAPTPGASWLPSSCPPPITVEVSGQTLAIPYDHLCTALGMLGVVVNIMGALTCAFIVVRA